MNSKKVDKLLIKYGNIIVLFVIFVFDLYEKNTYCVDSENWLHILYENISNSSLKNAASFCSLFALVIAMVQTIYPYRLGKILDYPVSKLNEAPFKEINIKELIIYAIAIIVTEFSGFYMLEVGVVLLGYYIIGKWLYKIVHLYRQYENGSVLLVNKIKEDLYIILKECGEKRNIAGEDLKEIFEHNITIDGVEEREVIKQTIKILSDKKSIFSLNINLNTVERRTIFEYSFYISNQLANKCVEINPIGYSWHYRVIKAEILTANYHDDFGEVFMKGALFGELAVNNSLIAEKFIDEILPELHGKMDRDCFGQLIGCLCIFLELCCNNQDEIIYMADLLVKSEWLSMMGSASPEKLLEKMEESYSYLIDSAILNGVDRFNIVEELITELVSDKPNKIPCTILGGLYAYYI